MYYSVYVCEKTFEKQEQIDAKKNLKFQNSIGKTLFFEFRTNFENKCGREFFKIIKKSKLEHFL